jgi:hypothetical protein
MMLAAWRGQEAAPYRGTGAAASRLRDADRDGDAGLRAASCTAPSRLRSKLAGRCYHRPFGFKIFPPNERWLTVYGDHPNYRNSRLTSRSGRTAGARPA